MVKLPTLYKTSAKGATQVCEISYEGDSYTVTWGQLNGSMQSKTTQCFPKNVGKASATTAEEQAEKEARAKWTIKQKANYSESIEAPTIINLPMKVDKYEKQKKKLDYNKGVFAAPKLNGINITIRRELNLLKYLSRGGEPRPVQEHQIKEINAVMDYLGTNKLCGEMYKHGEYLEDINSATTKINDLSSQLEFHIFDVPYEGKPYSFRSSALEQLPPMLTVKTVPGIWIKSEEDLDKFYEDCLTKGYEGIVVHTADSLYEYNKRSLTSMKRKPVLDAEFKTLRYEIDKNGHPVIWCHSEGGEFKAKPKGTDAQRKALVAKLDNLIGGWLTVEYESISKYGKPSKPIGICFRKCGPDGTPLE